MAGTVLYTCLYRTVFTFPPGFTHTLAIEEHAIAGTLVNTEADIAESASVELFTETSAIVALATVIAVVFAETSVAVQSFILRVTFTLAINTLAMSRTVINTLLSTTLLPTEPLFTNADARHTLPIPIAVLRTGLVGTVDALETIVAVALSLLARTMLETVIWTLQQSTVFAGPAGVADAFMSIQIADSIFIAVVGTFFSGAVITRPPLFTVTQSLFAGSMNAFERTGWQ